MALTGDYEPSTSGWVREHVEQILRTGTTDGVMINGLPTVLITYRGGKTGKVRKTPLMRVEHEGRYAAVASMGGAPTNPQWHASLVTDYADYQRKTDRQIPVFVLEPVSRGHTGR